MKLKKNCSKKPATAEVLLVLASSSIRVWQRTAYESQIGRQRMRRCGPTPALTIFFAYAPTSSYEEEEVKAFYMDLEKFYRKDHAFCKVAKTGP
ncbi:hypothetical protein RB195_025225 [Necator americanus]|uniref:Uncharacterized protein n=1 Tax=Necator americanus TaxID=51031 RepID=A0ABR1ERK5_NECAM